MPVEASAPAAMAAQRKLGISRLPWRAACTATACLDKRPARTGSAGPVGGQTIVCSAHSVQVGIPRDVERKHQGSESRPNPLKIQPTKLPSSKIPGDGSTAAKSAFAQKLYRSFVNWSPRGAE